MASIKQRINALSDSNDGKELKVILDALLADITAIRTGFVAATAQLDADAGITDTDDADNCDPAALTTTSQEI